MISASRGRAPFISGREAPLSLRIAQTAFLALLATLTAVPTAPAAVEASLEPSTAPVNDVCSGALVIADGPYPVLSTITTMVDAATGAGDPETSCIADPVENGVWYVWTPSVSRQYILQTCNPPTATTDGDGILAIYTSTGGCNGPFSQAGGSTGCNDDGCHGSGPSIVGPISLIGGTTYYILASHFPTASGGGPLITQYQIRIEPLLPPPNDTCAGALPLMLDMPVNATNLAAVNDYLLPAGSGCFGGIGQTATIAAGRDSVYSFTAPASDTYSFRAWNVPYGDPPLPTNPGGNIALYAASTCPAAPPAVTVSTCLSASNRRSANTAFVSTEELLCLPLSSGQQIFLYVDEATATTVGGYYTVEVTRCQRESEPNDAPASAGPLLCGLEGSISPAGDADFFALGAPPPPSGSRVFAFVDSAPAKDPDLNLRVTTTVDTLEFDDKDGDLPFGGGVEPTVAGTPLTGVSAFIRVNHFSTTAEPYRIYSVVQPPIGSATAESEPNDTAEDAGTAANLYFLGSLPGPAPSADADVYRFCADKGDLIYVGLDADPLRNETPINAGLGLFDKYAAELVQVDDDGTLSTNSPGTGFLTAVVPYSPAEGIVWRARYAGVYYAVASVNPTATGALGAGDYLLSISSNCLNGTQKLADLSINQSDGPDPVATGGNLGYTITVLNNGPHIAMNATLSGTTPANTTLVSLTAPPGWSCSAPPAGGTGAISCRTDCLPAAAPAIFTLVVKVGYCLGNSAPISGTAAVATDTHDPTHGNDSVLVTTSVVDPCDDGNSCTNDVCNAQNGTCSGHTPRADGSSCNDANPCTVNDLCAGGACSGTPIVVPPEVANLNILSDTTTLTWNSVSGAGPGTVHDVARGRVDELPVGFGVSEACVAPGITPATTTDATVPPARRAFWYLVRGRNSCGTGTYGSRSNGSPEVTAVCP